MLPGFRSLFVVVVLAISMLIFGLGAAALLRATHEEFASLPLKQMPEVTFASREAQQPTLAVLQVDPSAEPATPEANQAETQHLTPLSDAQLSDALPKNGPDAPATDALPAKDAPPAPDTLSATDSPAAPAGNDVPATSPPPSASAPATADTTPPVNTAAPEPSEPASRDETAVDASKAVKPPSDVAAAPAAQSDTSSAQEQEKPADVVETMTSPSGEHFKPPLPGHRPVEAAQVTADPSPSATKRSSAKEPRRAKHHRHKTRHSHR